MRFKTLLIDDEPWALEGMLLWIDWEQLGFEVCGTCGNGAEGLKLMEELRPDLVMVDIRMPVMNGLEMIGEWRKKNPHSPRFILLTGYSEFEYARMALRYGVNRYLLKPLDEEEASEEIRSIYAELTVERQREQIGRVASYEETLILLKQVLLNQTLSDEAAKFLSQLSGRADIWNVCLVQSPQGQSAPLGDLALESLAGDKEEYLIYLSLNRFAIVFGYPSGGRGEEGIWGRLEALRQRFEPFRVIMAVGGGRHMLMQAYSCYLEAKEALRHTFYDYRPVPFADYLDVAGRSFGCCYHHAWLLDKMLETFQLIDRAGYKAIIEEMVNELTSALIDPDTVRTMVIHLLYEIKDYINREIPRRDEQHAVRFNLPQDGESLLTLRDCAEHLHLLGNACFDLLLEARAGGDMGVVQDINDYIRAHYREGLTIKTLSERFYLHPAYLGQLLIRKNGISMSEMIHNLRIEEAARLLRAGVHKNSEVAEMVGYANYSQFLKQFEKRMAMSPNEYKKT